MRRICEYKSGILTLANIFIGGGMDNIKDSLNKYADEIGIDLFGVTSPEPFERLIKELEIREEHYRGRYAYRIDTWRKFAKPMEMMPEAKSVVVIGFYYYADEKVNSGLNGKMGRIVSYGHLGILKRSRLMCSFLKKRGFKAMMGAHRKEAAVRAGLGAIGKNNLVCNPKYGGWVAYQSIITDAEMEADPPFEKELCGDCILCLKACPTGALYEPYRIDPRRCVTCLLTSKAVSEDNLSKMGTSILGCDICLEACPKNIGLEPKKNVECLLPDSIGTQPPLKMMLDFTEDSFQEDLILKIQDKLSDKKFLNLIMKNKLLRNAISSLMKKFLKGKEMLPETFVHASGNMIIYKRNAIIAAGNLGDPAMLPEIRRFKDDPVLGAYAKWAEGKLVK
jgi:epoxyqueuosine reductase